VQAAPSFSSRGSWHAPQNRGGGAPSGNRFPPSTGSITWPALKPSTGVSLHGHARLTRNRRGIRQLGCSVIKLNLSWDKSRGPRQRGLRVCAASPPRTRSCAECWKCRSAIFFSGLTPLAESDPESERDEELYELGCYLLARYRGTGKQFYLGHWEGDWEIRGRAGSKEDPSPEAIEQKIRWLNAGRRR